MTLSPVLKRSSQSLLIIGPITTLAVSPASNYDPINLIKILFVSSLAFFNLGLFLASPKYIFSRVSKNFLAIISLFVLSMISTLLFSGAPIEQQIWGSFGRNTGFLTYLSLLIILIAMSVIQNQFTYHKIVDIVVYTAIPMTIYCLIQVANLDPISWSEKHPFGTLGNINFSSAFFGLTSIASFSLILDKSASKVKKIALLMLIIVDQFIVISTGSIQGFMIFIAGVGIVFYIFMSKKANLRIFKVLYIAISAIAIFFTIYGLSNKGPLAKFLFAPSIVFRTDYWHAGYSMTISHPIFGVGLDSYGDWYRQARGEISTLRTGPDRIANTAHNIFLDISSNGGLPFFVAYVLLNVLALTAAIRVLKGQSKYSPYFVALFATWLGYLIQSLISINQIGVGIWGWMFTGALIGYGYLDKFEEINLKNIRIKNSKKSRRMKSRDSVLPPLSGLSAIAGLLIGFTLAYIPFSADAKYKSAINLRAMDTIIQSTRLLGSSAFHSELALDTAIKNNLTEQAKEISDYLITKYPRDFMGWKARWVLSTSTDSQKAQAKRKLRALDPYNPEFK